jgi:hypothetical protein
MQYPILINVEGIPLFYLEETLVKYLFPFIIARLDEWMILVGVEKNAETVYVL